MLVNCESCLVIKSARSTTKIELARETGKFSNYQHYCSFKVVGRLDLGGPKCTGTALNHWNEVVSSPRRQIAEWHKLNEQMEIWSGH